MISAVNNNPSFTGIVPIRVFVDGYETFDEKLIKSATRQLTSRLTEPKKPENHAIARIFAMFDPKYKRNGYPEKTKPSEIFRCILDRGRAFLATGEQAELINRLGKDIGLEKQLCRERRVENSLDLIVSKRKYANTLSAIISSANFRLREMCESFRPVTLNINMNSNGKYGLSTFKMKLDNILFTT